MKRLLIVCVSALVLTLAGMAHAAETKPMPTTNSTSHMSTPAKHAVAPVKQQSAPAKHTPAPAQKAMKK